MREFSYLCYTFRIRDLIRVHCTTCTHIFKPCKLFCLSKQIHPDIYQDILAQQEEEKVHKSEGVKSVTKEMILDASLKLIVNEAMPISKIESQHFWDFVHST